MWREPEHSSRGNGGTPPGDVALLDGPVARRPAPTRPWHRSRPRPTRAAGEPTPSPAPGRFTPHIDALYLLAYLYLGERHLAEAAAVNAVARTAGDPAAVTARPPGVWRSLTSHVHPIMDSSDLLRRQREAVALVATGRSPSDTGALLGVSTRQVHRDVRTAIPAIRERLELTSPRGSRATVPVVTEPWTAPRSHGLRLVIGGGAPSPIAPPSLFVMRSDHG